MPTTPFAAANARYETALHAALPGCVVKADLAEKHEKMRRSPFLFLRATCFHWAENAAILCPELMPQSLVAAIGDAPRITDHLSPDAGAHFDRERSGLTALGVPFRLEPRLVRGLDYYTHTTFEFVSGALDAAQSTIGGGGRYDGLVEALGGPSTPGIGFGTGIERVLLTCDAEGVFPAPESRVSVYVIDTTGGV